MSIENEHHSGFNPETNVIEEDGDVKPYVSPLEPPDYLGSLPKVWDKEKLHPEVRNALHDGALEEDRLRTLGARPERISKIAHIPMERELIRLSLQKIDVDQAFPPDLEPKLSREEEFTLEEEALINRWMDTGGWNRDEAERMVKAKRAED